jgi:dTDP-4-dehydrorhamnose 3,5-epimerase
MRVAHSQVIPGLRWIMPTVSRDERGEFVETYNRDQYVFRRDDGSAIEFVEDDYSVSRRHVLRGLHGDDRTWKLMFCPYGALELAVVDCRRQLPSYRRWESFSLPGDDRLQVLVPAGCATGFVALADPTVLAYKQSERYRGAAAQFAVRWDDPAVGIDWPVERPILSERDATAPGLEP